MPMGPKTLLVVNTLVSANPGCQLFLNHDTTNHWIGFELEGVVLATGRCGRAGGGAFRSGLSENGRLFHWIQLQLLRSFDVQFWLG